MALWVRAATEADLPAILAIYNDAILTTTAVYQYEPHTIEMRQAWLQEKHAGGFPVFVAEDAGEVVGFGNLGVWRAAAAYKYVAENSVYVAAGHRGRGIGKRLLGELVDAANALNLHAVIAVIDADNTISIALHESFGFERAAHFRQVGRKFGRWLDLVFMELVLDGPAHPPE